MNEGKAGFQDEAHSDLDDDNSVDSHEQTVLGLPDGQGKRPGTGSWGTEDSARAQQPSGGQAPAQDTYSQPLQPPSDWQR